MAKMDGTKMERPILFSGEMVRAILEGRKSQTRRVQKLGVYANNPYGNAGDLLWVRETWAAYHLTSAEYDEYDEVGSDYERKPEKGDSIVYRADGKNFPDAWRPSIFMPRWASRINLEITGVRAQKIQECSEEDAKAEGSPKGGHSHVFGLDETYRGGFATRWDNLNKKRGFGWETNCWVWVIEFKKYAGEIANA